jgi:acetylglutamate kinase
MSEAQSSEKSFVAWFRHCASYIHAHRGRTFVVGFGGEAVADPEFHRLVHDLTLLSSLGVRLVVVHGTRPQIEVRLREAGLQSEFHEGLRITRPEALPCVMEAVGITRVEIESKFSMSQPDSPMYGSRVRVACGNFVTARPVGVRGGIDFWYTGEVRRVDVDAIRQRLDAGAVVLISNLGYSWTGEVFNLGVHDVASSVAEALGADKLVCLTEDAGLVDRHGKLLRELSPHAALDEVHARVDLSLDVRRWAQAAARACLGGVRRAHLLPRAERGAGAALARACGARDRPLRGAGARWPGGGLRRALRVRRRQRGRGLVFRRPSGVPQRWPGRQAARVRGAARGRRGHAQVVRAHDAHRALVPAARLPAFAAGRTAGGPPLTVQPGQGIEGALEAPAALSSTCP